MCGRFIQISPLTKINKFFDIDSITCEAIPHTIGRTICLCWTMGGMEKEDRSLYYSCTIIATETSESIQDIHNWMPVILKPEVTSETINKGSF